MRVSIASLNLTKHFVPHYHIRSLTDEERDLVIKYAKIERDVTGTVNEIERGQCIVKIHLFH